MNTVSPALPDGSNVTRSFSSTNVQEGDLFTVYLDVTMNGGNFAHNYSLIDEMYSSMFTMNDSGTGDTDDPRGNHIKWADIMEDAPIVPLPGSIRHSYNLTAPVGNTGTFSFDGLYLIDGMTDNNTIEGLTNVTVGPPCNLTEANWSAVETTNSTPVLLTVYGDSNCEGVEINFIVWEDDVDVPFLGELFGEGDDLANTQPGTAIFSGGRASVIWNAEWQCDGSLFGFFCTAGNPEYYFRASPISNTNNIIRSNDPLLTVTEASETCGNNFTQSTEDCDDGQNSDDTDLCYDSCEFTFCGDGILQTPNGRDMFDEACDGDIVACPAPGGYNGTRSCLSDCSGYNPVCTPTEWCGDGDVNGDEVCAIVAGTNINGSQCELDVGVCGCEIPDEDFDGVNKFGCGDPYDCDDTNPNISVTRAGFADNDSDTYTVGSSVAVCTNGTLPSGYLPPPGSSPVDCDDNNPNIWANLTGYADNDSDTYTVGGGIILCTNGTSVPTGYALFQTVLDCNDSNVNINPGAADVCNGINDDCNVSTADGSDEIAQLNTMQEGVCAGSLRSCLFGNMIDYYTGVSDYDNPESDTSCSDGLDNDCDTYIDSSDATNCVQCSVSDTSRCVDSTPICNITSNLCVQCLSNGDCSSPTPFCDSGGVCRECLNDGNCDDGEACNGVETCDTTTTFRCQAGTPMDCSSYGDNCNIGDCSGSTCFSNPIPLEGNSCDDGLGCTTPDSCSLGNCIGTPQNSSCTVQGESCNQNANSTSNPSGCQQTTCNSCTDCDVFTLFGDCNEVKCHTECNWGGECYYAPSIIFDDCVDETYACSDLVSECRDYSTEECVNDPCDLQCTLGGSNNCISTVITDQDGDGVSDTLDCNDNNVTIMHCGGCAECSVPENEIRDDGICTPGTDTIVSCPDNDLCGGPSNIGISTPCNTTQRAIFPESATANCVMIDDNRGRLREIEACHSAIVDCEDLTFEEYGNDDGDTICNYQDRCNGTFINQDAIYGYPKPIMTEFENHVYTKNITNWDAGNLTDFIIGIDNVAKVDFTGQRIKLFRETSPKVCEALDIDQYVNISYARVEIDSASISELNKPAIITMHDIILTSPYIIIDGVHCTDCVINSYENNVLSFNVTHFSSYGVGGRSPLTGDVVYEVRETPVTDPPGGSSNGGGGGGGGGGGAPPPPRTFDLNPTSIAIDIKQGEISTESFTINNVGRTDRDFVINTNSDMIDVDESLSLASGDSATVEFFVTVLPDKEPGIYIGKISVLSGDDLKELLVSINVGSGDSLFDVVLDLPEIFLRILPGNKIKFSVLLTKLTDVNALEVILSYIIKNEDGEEIVSKNAVMDITDTSTILEEELDLPKNLPAGEYSLYTQIEYDGKIANSAKWFDVESTAKRSQLWKLALIGFILVVIFLVIILYIKKKQQQDELSII